MWLERYLVEWRPCRDRLGVGLALALSIGLMASGCAGPTGSLRAGSGPQILAAAPVAPAHDLDSLMYAGGGAPAVFSVAAVSAAPSPAAEPASVYLLDSGDRLRIVVFGQEGLSNSYIVDAAGNITMPLIGAVPARDTSTSELARVVGARLRNGFIREPHVAIEVESYRPFFILGEVTYPGQCVFVTQRYGQDRGRNRRRLHAACLSLGSEGRPQRGRPGLPHGGTTHLCVAARRHDHHRRALVLRSRPRGAWATSPKPHPPGRHFFTFFLRNSSARCQASLPAASL